MVRKRVHQSSVNFRNLIRDLAEMYSQDISEVVVVEVIANSLDAKASLIKVDYDEKKKILSIEDNGEGMSKKQFEEYHDFAAGLKTRGTGIGFAGIGAKISFNIAERVATQTKGRSFSGGSDWYLAAKGKLVWEEIPPKDIKDSGTKVDIYFSKNTRPSYSNNNELAKVIKRNYLPLFDKKFLFLYDELGVYSKTLRFKVGGMSINPVNLKENYSLTNLHDFFPKVGGKKIGYGFIGLSETDYALDEGVCGLLLCTYGKVVKADMLNLFPGSNGPRILGLVETPAFIDFLTTAKNDFIRGRKTLRMFEKIYDPIRQEFKNWLKEIGVDTYEAAEGNEARRLERELKKIIDDVPELADFFGFRTKKNVLQQSSTLGVHSEEVEGVEVTYPIGEGETTVGPGPVDEGEEPGSAVKETPDGPEKAKPISRTSKRGPKITFSPRADLRDIAWVDGSSIVINSAHPSYKKASKNNSSKYLYSMFAIANAIQKFINTNSDTGEVDVLFVDRMITAWGNK